MQSSGSRAGAIAIPPRRDRQLPRPSGGRLLARSVRESSSAWEPWPGARLAGRGAPFQPRRAAALNNGGLLLYPMYHPAYIVRGAYAAQDYMWDFMRLERLCRRLASPRGRTDASVGRAVSCAKPTAHRLGSDLKSSPSSESAPVRAYALEAPGRMVEAVSFPRPAWVRTRSASICSPEVVTNEARLAIRAVGASALPDFVSGLARRYRHHRLRGAARGRCHCGPAPR